MTSFGLASPDSPKPARRRARPRAQIFDRKTRKSQGKLILFLSLWGTLSIIWAASVGYDVYNKAQEQADMARAVEADLDEGLVSVRCAGADCAQSTDRPQQSWTRIASTYMRFGADEMEEYVLGPPLALLIIGVGIALYRRGRHSAA